MRYALLIGLLVLVAACDSEVPSEPSAPDALVGSWTLQSSRYQLFLTSSVQQSISDASRPGTGSVDVTGDASARLVYAELADFGNAGPRQLSLSTYPPYTTPYPRDGYRLTLYSYPGESSYHAYFNIYRLNGDGDSYQQSLTSPPFSVEGARVRVAPVEISDAGRRFSASGVLTLPMTELAPGVPTLVREIPDQPGGLTVRSQYRFHPDRTYDYVFEGQDTQTGTWQVENDALTLTRLRGRETFTYTVEQGARLYITGTASPACGRDAQCLDIHAGGLGLAPGSLTFYDARRVFTYVGG